MITLPDPPPQIARLAKSDRGYPVPRFVCWFDENKNPLPYGKGEPDFRVIAPGYMAHCYNDDCCWICGGGLLGRARVYCIGPMCVINRITSEPPSHRECAEYAAKACPFMINPREKRSTKNMVEGGVVAGIHLDRNPGAIALYQAGKPKVFQTKNPDGTRGVLFQLGAPIRVDWWARGRSATREEILESIDGGMPHLTALAEKDGPEAVMQLAQMTSEAMKLLPAEALAEE